MTQARLALVAVIALTWSLSAQEIVRWKNGGAFEGKVREVRGSLLVTSVLGQREVASGDVLSRESSKALIKDFRSHQATRPESLPSARLALANWCLEQGLTSGCVEELDGMIRLVGLEDEGVQKLAANLSKSWRVHPDEDAGGGRERREYIQALFRSYATKGLTQAAIAAARLRALDEDAIFRLAMSELRGNSESARLLSATLLANYRRETVRVPLLYRRSLADPSGVVRRASTQALAVTGDPVFIKLYSKNLSNPSQAVRLSAVEAIANFGLKEGVAPLVAALKSSLRGPGETPVTRSHIAVTTQRAYVKDFDVEVAQGAVIADPIVDIIQEGVVLDVAVVSVNVERTLVTRALRRLSGVDFGLRVADWEAWLKNQSFGK